MEHNEIELLAPAGTLECGLAAFNYGADAVYLGMKLFSARADAGNFSLEDLQTLIGAAQSKRKVYVAVNTLVRESELPDLIGTLNELRNIGVNGLIVQDAALCRLVHSYFPEFELHASTQMSIHNAEGVCQAKRMGYSRVVAARELTMHELAEMAAVPGMEIEAFIHGALCYSYSGLCLLSACLNGCSGNRGECTYVCRNRFKVETPQGKCLANCSPFSMKDLATGDLINALRKAGVASLKIEGRKKTPLYVAAVTNYYRKLLDGTFKNGEEAQAAQDIKTIFSRPWTHFYLENGRQAGITDIATLGPRGVEVGQVARVKDDYLRFTVKNCAIEKHDGLQVEISGVSHPYGFGIDEIRAFTQAGNDRWERLFVAEPGTTVEVPLPDGYPELPIGSRICCTSSQAVHRRYSWQEARPALCRQRITVDCSLQIQPKRLSVTAKTQSGVQVSVAMELEEELSPAKNLAGMPLQCQDAFSRLGDTGFALGHLDLCNESGLFVPKSLLNEIRRRAADALQDALSEEEHLYYKKVLAETAAKTVAERGKPCYAIKIDHAYYLNMMQPKELHALDELVFALDRTRPDELDNVLTTLANTVGRDKVRLSIPVIVRSAVRHDYAPIVQRLLAQGWKRWEIGNLGAMDMLHSAGGSLDITADWSLYALNHLSAEEWFSRGIRRVTLCPEDTAENQYRLAELLGGRLTAVVFQEPVLARSAVCAMTSIKGFCPGIKECSFTELELHSAKGSHLVAVNDRCTTLLLGEAMDRMNEMPVFAERGVTHFRADFLWRNYSPAFVAETVRRMMM